MESIDHQCSPLRKSVASAGLAILAILAGSASSARADTITVTTNNDEFSVDGDCALREAIQSANNDMAFDACDAGNGDDTIIIPADVYGLKLGGSGEDANLTGDLDITSNIVLQGAGATDSQLFTMASDRLIQVHAGAVVEIRDMEMFNGTAPQGADDMTMMGTGGDGEHGGAIANSGTLLVADCAFSNNSAGRGGNGDVGGVGGSGGAVWSDGALTVQTSTFSGNTGGQGGASGPISMLIGGQGGHGGAIFSSGTLVIDRVTVSMNRGGNGGMGNTVGLGGAGGGLYQMGGSLLVSASTLSGNATGTGTSSDGGGAIYTTGGGTIINTTVTGNLSGPNDGGGIAAPGAVGLSVTHSTVVDNTPPGIVGNLGLRNSIVLGNADPGMMNYTDCAGVVTSDGYNLTGMSTGCPSIGTGDITASSGDVFSSVLSALSDNGGPTETHGVLIGSPIVDTGVCTDAMGADVTTDQRGAARPAGMACDIGSYESAPLPDTSGVVLIDITAEPAGGNCANGGQRIDVGTDIDGDSTLDPSEVESTSYVCNGQPGNPGNPGNPGSAVLVETNAELEGDNCAGGGVRIDAGVDDNRDGILDAEEIDSTTYVCNGSNGTDGQSPGASLIRVDALGTGTNRCEFGGSQIHVGIDDNGDGMLDDDEIDSSSLVCNADPGCNAGGQGAGLWLLLLGLAGLLWRRRRG